MKTYFSTSNPYDLAQSFAKIYNDFKLLLPQIRRRYHHQTDFNLYSPGNDFLKLMAELERLYYLDNPKDIHTFNASYYKKGVKLDDLITRAEERNPKTAFIICEDASTKFRPMTNIKRMPALEESLKETPRHFLVIGTHEHTLLVYTNKTLPFNTILKLKRIQWSLFKDLTSTPKPEIKEFMECIENITRNNDNELNRANRIINDIFNLKELEDMRFEELKDLFKPDFRYQIENLEGNKNRLENDYISTENRLSAIITQINDLNEQIVTLHTRMENDKSDAAPLIKYLIKHPYIQDFSKFSQEQIRMYFESPLVYFDPYMIDKIYPHKTKTEQEILKAIKDNKYELMTRCEVLFNTRTFGIQFNTVGHSTIFGHPHIDRFHCFGNHNVAIRESAKTSDYLGAIEQISQATLNINFADARVVDYMLRTLRECTYLQTWRSKETGVMLTTNEIMEIYHEEA